MSWTLLLSLGSLLVSLVALLLLPAKSDGAYKPYAVTVRGDHYVTYARTASEAVLQVCSALGARETGVRQLSSDWLDSI